MHASNGPELDVVSKIPRPALESFARAMRKHADSPGQRYRDLPAAVTKLETRLRAKRGPKVKSDLWRQRVADMERAAHALEREQGYPPTDAQIERELSWAAGSLARWRYRKPGIFGRRP